MRRQNSAGVRSAAVDELLAAEADGQRHDLDAELVGDRLGQIAGAVGDDAYGHGGVRLVLRLSSIASRLRRGHFLGGFVGRRMAPALADA